MSIPRRKLKELECIVSKLPGFILHEVTQDNKGHLCCHIEDDAGNRFRLWAAGSGKSCGRRQMNFKSDVRKMSNKLKGLVG